MNRTLHLSDNLSAEPLPAVAGYEVLQFLGRGSTGTVYRARQLGPDRMVALKLVAPDCLAAPEDLQRFRAVTDSLARWLHPHVAAIFETFEENGQTFVATELLEGGNLSPDGADGLPAPRQAAELMVPLARTIQEAHDRGIVHLDLKPANVRRAADGTPKLTDFGLARRWDAEVGVPNVRGTPGFMAPEQAEGRVEDIGPRCDIYGLGATLYELLSGRPPFRGETAVQTLQQVLSEEAAPLSNLRFDVPWVLDIICQKCLQKETAVRYRSPGELVEDLRHFLTSPPFPVAPERYVAEVPRGAVGRWFRKAFGG